MITENIPTLKIHKMKSQKQYERELEAGNIDENALYLIPDEATVETFLGSPVYKFAWNNNFQPINANETIVIEQAVDFEYAIITNISGCFGIYEDDVLSDGYYPVDAQIQVYTLPNGEDTTKLDLYVHNLRATPIEVSLIVELIEA